MLGVEEIFVMDDLIITLIIYGIIVVLSFGVQLFLCFRLKRVPIKLIPISINLICFLLIALITVFLSNGWSSREWIATFLIFVGTGVAFLGNTMAWIVYGISKKVQR